MDKELPKYVLVSIALFFIIFYGAMLLFAKTVPEGTDLLDYTYREHTNLEMHIHPELEIWILGEKRPVPADIGIMDGGMRVIHTHDDSGKMHIESPWEHQFFLKDFFYVWGERFDERCIFDYCADGNHTLEVFVNGERSGLYGETPLREGDRIRIVYRSR